MSLSYFVLSFLDDVLGTSVCEELDDDVPSGLELLKSHILQSREIDGILVSGSSNFVTQFRMFVVQN